MTIIHSEGFMPAEITQDVYPLLKEVVNLGWPSEGALISDRTVAVFKIKWKI